MRPLESRFDPSRSPPGKDELPRFIIVSEGYRTEPNYFQTLSENRQIAGISSLIDIVVLQREVIDAGVSCPKSILDILDEYMASVRLGRYSIGLFIDGISSSSGLTHSEAALFRKRVIDDAQGLIDESGFIIDENKVMDICKRCYVDIFGRKPILDIPKLVDYCEDVDRICVIVDRDRDNRTSSDIDDFIRRCKRSGYEPYVTNPCFELWLLMHFEAFYNLDHKMLLDNPMIGGRRFTELELDRVIRSINPDNRYDKVDYDPWSFLHRLGDAIDNSRTVCHDVLRLKSELGTNLGLLLDDMRVLKRS